MSNLEILERVQQLEQQVASMRHTLKSVFSQCVWVGFPRELNIGDKNLSVCGERNSEREGWLFRRSIDPRVFDE